MVKQIVVFAFIFIAATAAAQDWYVAAKSGLSMRDKPDAKAAILEKIPYGTKLTVTYPEAIVNISTEGLEGAWAKITYNGKTGYIVNSYLLPWAPPKPTVKTMKEYFQQIAALAAVPLIVTKGHSDTLESEFYTLKKSLYKNGAEAQEEGFYESNNNNYFLPGFSLQQGFVLLRLIPEFKDVFTATDFFPSENKKVVRRDGEYSLRLEKEKSGDMEWLSRIVVEYTEGAVYSFAMYVTGGQLIISYGGGL